MKNEKKFKQKISEIAARIAEGSYGDAEKEMEPKEKEGEIFWNKYQTIS